jgi:hypothetical protein
MKHNYTNWNRLKVIENVFAKKVINLVWLVTLLQDNLLNEEVYSTEPSLSASVPWILN